MASFILGTVGRIVFGPIGGFIGALAGSVIDSFLFGSDITILGPKLDNTKVTSSAYGKPIPLLYGTMRVGGNVVWSPGLVEHRQEETQGGKGGGPSITTVTFLYTASFRINFCEGVAEFILRVWGDGKLIGDLTSKDPAGVLAAATSLAALVLFGGLEGGQPGNPAVRIYLGDEAQLPDPAEQADKGVANTPAYRGQVGIGFQDFLLTDFGNRIPQLTAEVVMEATEIFPVTTLTGVGPTNFVEWQPGGATFVGKDAGDSFGTFDLLNVAGLTTGNVQTFPNFPCIDSEGNFYRATDGFGGPDGGIVTKYDGVTLALIQTGNPMVDPATGADVSSSLNWQGGQIFGGILLADGTMAGELLWLGRDTLSSTSDFAVVDIANLGDPNGGVVNFDTAPTALDWRTTVDSERFLWAFSTDEGSPSTVILYRISPAIGEIVETHTVSAVGDITSLHIGYESSTNSIILCNGPTLLRWDIDTQTIDCRLDNISPAILTGSANRNDSAFRHGPNALGIMYLQTGAVLGEFSEFDVLNCTKGRSWDINADWGLDGSDVQFGVYDPIHHAVIKWENPPGNIVHWLYLDRHGADEITVRSIVEDVSSRVGLVAGTDINATALTSTLPGYIVDRRMPSRRALEPLARGFFFRSVETDFLIKFVKRGGAASFSIPEDDLGAATTIDAERTDIEETRIQEVELPAVVDVIYLDPLIDYQAQEQRAQRISEAVNTERQISFTFPGALRNLQAAQMAERLLYIEWQNRTRYAFAVDWGHLRIDPADVGTVVKGNATFTIEIEDTDFDADGIIKMRGVSDDAVVHSSTAGGIAALGVPTQSIALTFPSALFLIDTPLLRDVDDGAFTVYVAAGAFGAHSWPGAAVFKSSDNIDFTTLFASIPSNRNVAHGLTTTVLGDDGARTWDEVNTVTVRLSRGSLATDTDLNVLNGANSLLIGDEILQFVTATLNANGTYTLSRLLRGRRGTEGETDRHLTTGERVVVLTSSTILLEQLDTSDLNILSFYKAITIGASLAQATNDNLTYLGRALQPYSPVEISGSVGSPSDWEITWVRRTRVGGAWIDKQDVLLSEDSEAYEVDIINPGSPSDEVVRKITSTASAGGSVVITASSKAFYTSADQATDFGSEQTTIIVKVYQISAQVTRGFPGDATLVA